MSKDAFQIRQLADELQLPQTGKQSIVVADDDNAKVVLFAFAATDGQRPNVLGGTWILFSRFGFDVISE